MLSIVRATQHVLCFSFATAPTYMTVPVLNTPHGDIKEDVKSVNCPSFQAPYPPELLQERHRSTGPTIVDNGIQNTSRFRVPESGEMTRRNEWACLFDQNVSNRSTEERSY